VLIGVLLLALQPQPVRGAGPDKDLYPRLLRSTCWIVTDNGASATGWLLNQKRRQVITNYHVVKEGSSAKVSFPEFRDGTAINNRDHYITKGHWVSAKVLSQDSKRDLALLELQSVPDGCVELKLAAQPLVGQERVHAIGNPGSQPLLWVYSSGTVVTVPNRKPGRLTDGQQINASRFRVQMPIGPGCSGGPVVNDKGELVGVNHASQIGSDLLATPIAVSEVKAFLEAAAPEKDAAARSRLLREEGIKLLRNSDYRGAINQLSRAIELNGTDHVAFNERGAAYTWLNQDSEAIKDFSRAIVLSPKNAVAYRNRGAAHLRQGQPQMALDDLNQAIALSPEYTRAYKDRGDAYTRLGKAKEAKADYQKAADLKRRAESGR
jgi:hypothetical protein